MRVYVRKLRSIRNGKTFIPYNSYTEEALRNALESINSKRLSLNDASKLYKIPKATLSRKRRNLNSKQEKAGHPTLFSIIEEKAFIHFIKILSNWGFPFDLMDLRILAQKYLNKIGKKVYTLKDNMPGQDWARNFLRRHKHEISFRTASNISTDRAKVSQEMVNIFFGNWTQTVIDVDPSRIINYDETNLTDDPGNRKYIYKRGIKYPERVINTSKTAVSLMFSATASGFLLPVYVVYKAEHLWDTWLEGGPKDTYYNRSKSGWFDNICFEDWFNSIIVPYAKKQNGEKVVVVGDNLSSHFSENVLKTCDELNIEFTCLPAKSTHLLQPLDVALYGPLKHYWRKTLTEWKELEGRKHKTLVKSCFPRLLNNLLTRLSENDAGSKNIIAGFKKCGLYPVNPEEPLSRLPQSSIVPEEINLTTADAIIEILQEMRGVSAPQSETRRKKRCQVPPGKGIRADDILPAVSKTTKAKKKKNKSNVTSKQTKKTRSTSNDSTPETVSLDDDDDMLSDTSTVIDITGIDTYDISAPGPSGVNRKRQSKNEKTSAKGKKQKMSPIKTVKGKGVGKKSRICEKENLVPNTQMKIKSSIKKKSRRLSSCSTSVTDNISLRSDSDITDIFEDFVDRDLEFRNIIFSDVESEEVITTEVNDKQDAFPDKEPEKVRGESDEREKKSPEEVASSDGMKEPARNERNMETTDIFTDKEIEVGASSEDRAKKLEEDIRNQEMSVISDTEQQIGASSQERVKKSKEDDRNNEMSVSNEPGGFFDRSLEGGSLEERAKKPEEDERNKDMSENDEPSGFFDRKPEEGAISEERAKTLEKPEDAEENYEINEHVLVRYYRKKWKYYIGFVESILSGSDKSYEIRFYKTCKNPLRFVFPKRPDRDIVPALCIVKKIHLNQGHNNSKEFFLLNNEDDIYFS